MRNSYFQRLVFRITSVLLLCMGFVQVSSAGVAGTQQMIDSEVREQQIDRAEAFLARQDVAAQMAEFGVDADDIADRLQHLTNAELLALNGQMENQIAGGDAIGIIGTVFLVLLILELVGVTDVFTAI